MKGKWTLCLILGILSVIVGLIVWQFYIDQRLHGDWRAAFQPVSTDENTEQGKFLKIIFNSDGSIVYKLTTAVTINSLDVRSNSSVSSRGYSEISKSFKGTYRLSGQHIEAAFPVDESDSFGFEPFGVENLKFDRSSGKTTAHVSWNADFRDDQLILQTDPKSPKITLSKTPDGFPNSFSFLIKKDSNNSSAALPGTKFVATATQFHDMNSASFSPADDSDANDTAATSELRELSTACETFATVNSGRYPSAIEDLTQSSPAYINHSCCGKTISGYAFSCQFSESGYQVKAEPVQGGRNFTILTGGILK